MNADSVEPLVRLVVALVILASLVVGQSGRLPRVRQRLARALSSRNRTSRGSPASAGPESGGPVRGARERRRAFLRELAVALLLAALLFALATNLSDEFASADSRPARLLIGF